MNRVMDGGVYPEVVVAALSRVGAVAIAHQSGHVQLCMEDRSIGRPFRHRRDFHSSGPIDRTIDTHNGRLRLRAYAFSAWMAR